MELLQAFIRTKDFDNSTSSNSATKNNLEAFSLKNKILGIFRRYNSELLVLCKRIGSNKAKIEGFRFYKGVFKDEPGVSLAHVEDCSLFGHSVEHLAIVPNSNFVAKIVGEVSLFTISTVDVPAMDIGFWDDLVDINQVNRLFGFDFKNSNVQHRIALNSRIENDLSLKNINAVKVMQRNLKVDDYATLMNGSFESFMKADRSDYFYYDAIREMQSKKWSKDKVAEGVILAKRGEHDEAIKLYDMALQLEPKRVDAFVARGAAYANKKRYDMAIDDFNIALRIDPKCANASKYLVATKRKKAMCLIATAVPKLPSPKHVPSNNTSTRPSLPDTATNLEPSRLYKILEKELKTPSRKRKKDKRTHKSTSRKKRSSSSKKKRHRSQS